MTRADHWFELEKSRWRAYFYSLLLQYVNDVQTPLAELYEKISHSMGISKDRVLKLELRGARDFQKTKDGRFIFYAECTMYYFRERPQENVCERQNWAGEVGPIDVATGRQLWMATRALLSYISSEHVLMHYFPIGIGGATLAKFVALYGSR